MGAISLLIDWIISFIGVLERKCRTDRISQTNPISLIA